MLGNCLSPLRFTERFQSDWQAAWRHATLGCERVCDTEAGEYYKAEAGFDNRQERQRYTVVDDASYLSPVSKYIDWK